MATPAIINSNNLPTVALIGRVNVGKSTLFNCLTETSKAIISNVPGTTRTRNIGLVNWRGKNFNIIDTGGLTFEKDIPFEEDVIEQTDIAIKESEVILFVVDLKNELLPQEKELAKKINRRFKGKKNIILIGNKADNATDRSRIYDPEWKKLGFGEPIPVSAVNGSNIGDLLDIIYKYLSKQKRKPKTTEEIPALKVALAGKPNVGKSSLFNKLIGEDRVIVSDVAHTTREPHDTLVEVDNEAILFIDTAGIRKKSRVGGALEKLSVAKSLESIERADIVLMVLDTSEPISDQDKQLAGFISEHGKSAIFVVNKWDLAEDNEDTFRNEVMKLIYKEFPHLSYAPIVFTSAKSGYRTHQIFPLLQRAKQERLTNINQADLQDFLKRAVKKRLPSRGKGVRHPKIMSIKQISIGPPVFQIVIKQKTSLHPSYINFLKNRLRERFGFYASPIIIKLKKNIT